MSLLIRVCSFSHKKSPNHCKKWQKYALIYKNKKTCTQSNFKGIEFNFSIIINAPKKFTNTVHPRENFTKQKMSEIEQVTLPIFFCKFTKILKLQPKKPIFRDFVQNV